MTPTKQRKSPIKRAFPGMIGPTPGPEAAAAPLPEPIPVMSQTTEDRILVCDDCYQEFLFSIEQQVFCAENQLKPPRRCNTCEAAAIEQVQQSENTEAPVPPPHVSPAAELENIEGTKAKKEAERQRARRKLKREQIAAIKKALKTPVADIKKAAKAKAEAERLPSMNQGTYMGDAPTGKGALVYKSPKKIDQIDAAINRSVPLGSATIDKETGEAFFADNDRERVVPEGLGAASDDKAEMTGEIIGLSSKGRIYGDSGEQERKFQVKLAGPEYQSGLSAAVNEYTFQDGFEIFCRLCQQAFERIENHFMQAHGDPQEPEHNHRFGDVIEKYVRKFKQKHAKLEKVGRKKALEALADAKARAEIEAIRAGYVKLNGKWILKPRTG